MADFRVVLVEHGYSDRHYERDAIAAAGGELVDAENRPLDEALELCRAADGILLRRTELTAGMIRNFGRCRIIVRYGIGTDNIDVAAATDAGIIVGNVPDYCLDEVSTHAIALLLGCVRNLCGTHARMTEGDWDIRRPAPVFQMEGRTLGLVGLGQIGSKVARKMGPWGMKILATDPFVEHSHARDLGVKLVDLESLLGQSDYLSLHVPLLPETHHLIGPVQLGAIKRGCILVNTSRGRVLDTEALIAALDGGRVSCAALDVFEQEPLSADSPLRRHPRLVLTDHTAWYSEEAQVRLQISAAESVVVGCTGGVPASIANPRVLHKLGKFDQWRPAANMGWQLARMSRMGER
jgi:D-3-phosphoglycerate dehydrogenase